MLCYVVHIKLPFSINALLADKSGGYCFPFWPRWMGHLGHSGSESKCGCSTELHQMACPGLRELSLNLLLGADGLSFGRPRYRLHYAAKFQTYMPFSEALYIKALVLLLNSCPSCLLAFFRYSKGSWGPLWEGHLGGESSGLCTRLISTLWREGRAVVVKVHTHSDLNRWMGINEAMWNKWVNLPVPHSPIPTVSPDDIFS